MEVNTFYISFLHLGLAISANKQSGWNLKFSFIICQPRILDSYYLKMISCEWKAYGNYINNLDSVLISCLNPDIFVVLEKPL